MSWSDTTPGQVRGGRKSE